jgi:hypothetical protein
MTPTQSGPTQLGRDLAIFPRPATWHSIYHPRPQLNRYSKIEARQRLRWSTDEIYLIAVGRFYLTACSGMAGYRGLYFSQPQREYAEAFLELNATSWQAVLTYLLQIREYQERCLRLDSGKITIEM